jgi:S-formylglutathione hydrolase
MGGHGALTVALKNPGRYCSVSAFSPIVAPSRVPWGEKAFSAYLGSDRETWRAYDTTELVKTANEKIPLLIEQGDADEFLQTQLKPELLKEAGDAVGYPLEVRMRAGYDHSYYFVASFIGEHVAYHAEALRA